MEWRSVEKWSEAAVIVLPFGKAKPGTGASSSDMAAAETGKWAKVRRKYGIVHRY